MSNDELKDPDFESEYMDDYEGMLESCPNCSREYDDIDFDYQICSHCKYNAMTPSKQEFENECLNKPTPPKQQSIEDVAYTEDQVRTAYKAGVLRGLEYKSRGKKKTVY